MIRPNRQHTLALTAFLSAVLLLLISGCSAGTDNQAAGTGTTPTAASAASNKDVTIRVGQTGWGNLELGLKAAGLDDTPIKSLITYFREVT